MEIATFTELITNFGLPIALIVAMGVFIYIIYKQSVKREEKLMAELTECRVVNTKAIETLALYADRLTHIEGDITEIKDDLILIKDKV